MENVDQAGTFVTDDYPALDFALARGIAAVDTRKILAECFAMSEIGCPDAFNLMLEMRAHDRGIRVPADHAAVCPK